MSAGRRRATQGLGGLGALSMLDGDRAEAPDRADDGQGGAAADSVEAPAVRRVPVERAEPVAPVEAAAPAPAARPVPASEPRPAPKRRRRIRERRVGMERLYNGDIARTTITMPAVVDDALAEIVFSQRKTTRRNKNDLMLEGIEAVLKKYGKGSISTLVKQAEEG